VRNDITGLGFNTAVATLITLNNHLTKVAADTGSPRDVAEPRARLQLPASTEPAAVQDAALQRPRVVELLAGASPPGKIIVVLGQLVSTVA
jgi:hypothetical protein